jgi:hypothetical protein
MKCGSERQLQSQPAARTQPINRNSRPDSHATPRRSCDGLRQCSSQVRSGTEPAFPSDWVRSLCPRVELPFEHASRRTTSHDLVQLRTQAVRRRRAWTAQRASHECLVHGSQRWPDRVHGMRRHPEITASADTCRLRRCPCQARFALRINSMTLTTLEAVRGAGCGGRLHNGSMREPQDVRYGVFLTPDARSSAAVTTIHQLRPGAVWAGLGATIPPYVTLAGSLPLVDGESELLAVVGSVVAANPTFQVHNSGVDRLARASFSTSTTRWMHTEHRPGRPRRQPGARPATAAASRGWTTGR